MTNEHTGFSRRKLLKAGAIGVPAAGVLAFGSTLVTATSANAISADGWWGSETSAGFQRFMNAVMGANLVVDGVISSQDAAMQTWCPGIVGGWEWVPYYQATGSPTITYMHKWLGNKATDGKFSPTDIAALQKHYGVSVDGSLDGPSQTIKALQNEINQWV
ncbi:hypothetical protein [Rothia aeria]|uniref:hypothetical protein n=1 Tax=Rothia aeria TaxID=172042 RepID=UPI00051D1137|nr:hypothetical protein [Rothia aeria]KGI99658.1 chemotaxis protein CheA [Rothia aeria]KGJ31861.1 chemotaxis protein CheA [Rothia aeria]